MQSKYLLSVLQYLWLLSLRLISGNVLTARLSRAVVAIAGAVARLFKIPIPIKTFVLGESRNQSLRLTQVRMWTTGRIRWIGSPPARAARFKFKATGEPILT